MVEPFISSKFESSEVPFALFLIGRCVEQLARHRPSHKVVKAVVSHVRAAVVLGTGAGGSPSRRRNWQVTGKGETWRDIESLDES